MMTKMRSKKSAWLKVLLAMPVLAILLIAFAANTPASADEGDYVVKGKVVEANSGEAMPGVSVIWKGTTNGTVSGMDGTYSLNVNDKEAVVVYSFVGYKTTKTVGDGEHTVKLERMVYKISPDYEKKMKMKEAQKKKDIAAKMENMSEEEKMKFKEKMKKEAEMEKKAASGKGEDVFFIVEDMPKFQGKTHHACHAWVQKNLEYPKAEKEKGINGVVYVLFVVDANGKVSKAKVKKGVDPALDKAALKAVYSMPDWTPGKQRGKPVSTQFMIPVKFSPGDA